MSLRPLLEELSALVKGDLVEKKGPSTKSKKAAAKKAAKAGTKKKKKWNPNAPRESDPFKYRGMNGAGPRGRIAQKRKKSQRLKCRCNKYSCVCKNKSTGEKKVFKIDKKYKKAYNKEYRRWAKKNG